VKEPVAGDWVPAAEKAVGTSDTLDTICAHHAHSYSHPPRQCPHSLTLHIPHMMEALQQIHFKLSPIYNRHSIVSKPRLTQVHYVEWYNDQTAFDLIMFAIDMLVCSWQNDKIYDTLCNKYMLNCHQLTVDAIEFLSQGWLSILCGMVQWSKWPTMFAIQHVSEKNKQTYFCYNYVKLPPNLIIFGCKIANCLKLYEMHSLSTSSDSCQCTTMLNADFQIVTQRCRPNY